MGKILEVPEKGIHILKFTKLDGTVREMECTKDPEIISKHIELKEESEKTRTVNSSIETIFDLGKLDWRSCRKSNIISVEPKDVPIEKTKKPRGKKK